MRHTSYGVAESSVDVLIADVTNSASLDKIAAQARVVVTPWSFFVVACMKWKFLCVCGVCVCMCVCVCVCVCVCLADGSCQRWVHFSTTANRYRIAPLRVDAELCTGSRL